MANQPRYRLARPESLASGQLLQLSGNEAHYALNVLRLKAGDRIALFNPAQGEFAAALVGRDKRTATFEIAEKLRAPENGTGLMVCFAPIKGGRLETIIEKATELGADILQPVLMQRSVVDKVNRTRAESIAREAAEQCERISWPEIREPIKLLPLLGDWPTHVPLIYGDETGASAPLQQVLAQRSRERAEQPKNWAILIGPEGGFAPEELAALRHVNTAQGVSLGPRILRADTAVITLAAATLMAWGDWERTPRFERTDA